MRLKLDENLSGALRDELVRLGHDVHTCADEGLAGRPDPDVFVACVAEGRVLLTLDGDFGDIRRYPPGTHPGIALLRPAGDDVASCIAVAVRFLAHVSPADVPGNLYIVDDARIRVRRPPDP